MKSPRSRRAQPLPPGVELNMVRAIDLGPPCYDMDAHIDRAMALLNAGRRHPVLVGPSEVGKSAVAWGIARRISAGARPAGAKAMWEVSLRTLDAEFGKESGVGVPLARILHSASEAASKPIVFVRDLGMLRALDAQHALVEALLHLDVRFLGEAWPQFASWAAEDPELAAVSHIVRVDEMSPEGTLGVLRAHVGQLRGPTGVTADAAALERVIRHAERLLPHRKLPGKAVALLDESLREAAARPERRLTPALVTKRICEAVRVPRFLVDPDEDFDPAALAARLRARVVGQDDAIEAVIHSLALYKVDLSDENRPLGVFMLAGPPGVGKTLLAQRVAEYVFGSADRLIRVSLAEHSEDWKVDQLFGQRGAPTLEARRGLLARQLGGKPFAVLLLDEIEKAHPLAYKHLLRPLDEGKYVNGNDEEVSLQNTLVIMTSSVGAEVYREPVLGFARGDVAARAESVRKRIADQFPADLLDRIDRVCVCPPLGSGDLVQVARREIDAALGRAGVQRRGIVISIDPEVIERVVADALAGPGGALGARAVRRAVERAVIAPLALHLLEKRPQPGMVVQITLHDGAIVPTSAHPVTSASLRTSRRELRVSGSGRPGEAIGAAALAGAEASSVAGERAAARRRTRAPTG